MLVSASYLGSHIARAWSNKALNPAIFPVGDAERLEFRVEAYNVLNSFRAMNPSVTLSDTNTFGVIREALDPRILQFALKYVSDLQGRSVGRGGRL
jgi:hypothetical protein